MAGKSKLTVALLDIIKPGNFYDIDGLKQQLLNMNVPHTGKQLPSALQSLKRAGTVHYNRDNKMWVATPSHPANTPATKPAMQVELKEDLSDIQKRMQDVVDEIDFKKIIESEDTHGELESGGVPDPEIAEINLVSRIDAIVGRMVTEELIAQITQNKEAMILKAVKRVIKDEFRLQVVPVLLTNIKDRIDQELSVRVGKVKEESAGVGNELSRLVLILSEVGKYLQEQLNVS